MRTPEFLSFAPVPPPGFQSLDAADARHLRGRLFVLHAPAFAQAEAWLAAWKHRLTGLVVAPDARQVGLGPTLLAEPWPEGGRAPAEYTACLTLIDATYDLRNRAEQAELRVEHQRQTLERLQDQIDEQRRQRSIQRRVQHELEVQRALFLAQQAVAIDGTVIFAQDGRVLYRNQRYLDLFHIPPDIADHRDRLVPHVAAQLAENSLVPHFTHDHLGNELRERTEIALRDGRILDRFTAPLSAPDGSELGRAWFYRDITVERQREAALLKAKEEAESAGRAKATFLATMSHELRTPLTGILVTADLLRELDLPEEHRQLLDGLVRSGTHLHHLLSETLDLSALEAGALRLRSQDTDPAVLLREVAEIARPLAAAKKLAFVFELAPGMPSRLHVDPGRLRQVLLNLISNAIKFTSTGTITLWGWGSAEGFACAVSDTGPGVPTDQIDHLFRPFTQLSDGPSRPHEGTGLGLAIVRELVLLMGGTVGVESQVGLGSVFTIRIPLGHRP